MLFQVPAAEPECGGPPEPPHPDPAEPAAERHRLGHGEAWGKFIRLVVLATYIAPGRFRSVPAVAPI